MKRQTIARGAALPRACLCTVLAASLAISGCASPYVRSSPPPDTNQEQRPATLSQALGYSRAVHEAYRSKVVELGEAERLNVNGFITLAGAMLGVAWLGGHANALRNAAVAGGTGLTLGYVNSDQRRAMIYVAGMRALECANEAVAPFDLHPEIVKDLGGRLEAVRSGTQETSKAFGKTMAAAMLVGQRIPEAQAALKAAQEALDAGRDALQKADDAQTAAEDLLVRHALAGGHLHGAVQRIDAAVLDAARGTEVALPLLPRILAGLADNVAVFSNVAGTPRPGAAEAHAAKVQGLTTGQDPKGQRVADKDEQKLLEQLSEAVSELWAQSAHLRARSTRLSRSVTAILDRVNPELGAKCEVRAPVMALAPDTLTFIEKVEETQVVEVRDGKWPYRPPMFVPSVPAGLTASFALNDARQSLLTVKADQNAAGPATHKIAVVDSLGDVRFLTVQVAKPAASLAEIKAHIVSLSPLTIAGVKVDLLDVTARDGGGFDVSYKPEAGKSVKSADVQDALAKDAKLRGMLGKGTVVAKAAP